MQKYTNCLVVIGNRKLFGIDHVSLGVFFLSRLVRGNISSRRFIFAIQTNLMWFKCNNVRNNKKKMKKNLKSARARAHTHTASNPVWEETNYTRKDGNAAQLEQTAVACILHIL